jgi:hypothetical protein
VRRAPNTVEPSTAPRERRRTAARMYTGPSLRRCVARLAGGRDPRRRDPTGSVPEMDLDSLIRRALVDFGERTQCSLVPR